MSEQRGKGDGKGDEDVESGERGGLRARKKRTTARRIEAVALDLFERDGFGATTVEAIAASADIAPRTFFHYFPTKEDVVLADYEDRLERVTKTLEEQPPEMPPWQALAAAFRAVADDYERTRAEIVRRFRIMAATGSVVRPESATPGRLGRRRRRRAHPTNGREQRRRRTPTARGGGRRGDALGVAPVAGRRHRRQPARFGPEQLPAPRAGTRHDPLMPFSARCGSSSDFNSPKVAATSASSTGPIAPASAVGVGQPGRAPSRSASVLLLRDGGQDVGTCGASGRKRARRDAHDRRRHE